MTFAETADGAAFVTARADHGEAAPLWLLEKLVVDRGRRSMVIAAPNVDVARFAAPGGGGGRRRAAGAPALARSSRRGGSPVPRPS